MRQRTCAADAGKPLASGIGSKHFADFSVEGFDPQVDLTEKLEEFHDGFTSHAGQAVGSISEYLGYGLPSPSD
ncbi:hypothetical protein [Magnetospirillum gryphiswaldense]|uniref:hypothetical protein n=1 Tax=Magnetospirillum gryphiswaldense TaxID=55518 RepID=UPI000D22541B|nr:hypothetical protein [Magnetospirillum gryphiswaldense]AVM75814.1 hypothetical protein MSR1_33510 [Magnetospirillum gryphiswaldense MSR-1]AVM79717.1 hypothetical protein MSR1L_33510 [Magnetospirillum gryphiswaldense]